MDESHETVMKTEDRRQNQVVVGPEKKEHGVKLQIL